MIRLFITHLVGRQVLDPKRQPLGKLEELLVGTLPGHLRVSGMVIGKGKKARYLPWSAVDHMENRDLVLRKPLDDFGPPEPVPEDRIRLVRDLLDSQVVDTNGAKVVRVNDIQLMVAAERLYVVGVDIGTWGLFRRLGLAWFLASVVRRLHLRIQEGIVPWDVVDPIDKGFGRVKLKVTHDRITRLHPADLADILEELGHEQRGQLLAEMTDEQVADVVEESEPEMQTAILHEIGADRAADVLEEMEPDEAADLLGDLPEDQAQELMGLMEADEAAEVQELLAHPERTAGSLMTTSFIRLPDTLTVGDVLAYFKANRPKAEVAAYVYLVDDDGHLTEVVSLRRVLMAEPGDRLIDLAKHQLMKVSVDEHQDEVINLIDRYKLTALPVVDEQERLVGVVSVNDVLDLLLPEERRTG